jgi:hypothetical protein
MLLTERAASNSVMMIKLLIYFYPYSSDDVGDDVGDVPVMMLT